MRTRPSSTMRALSVRVLKNRARQSQTSMRQASSGTFPPRLATKSPRTRRFQTQRGQGGERRVGGGVALGGPLSGRHLAPGDRLTPFGPAGDDVAQSTQDQIGVGLAPAQFFTRLVGKQNPC